MNEFMDWLCKWIIIVMIIGGCFAFIIGLICTILEEFGI